MYQEQRIEKILELLDERGRLSSKEMVTYFDVSRDTIRRDFSLLSKEGKVKRTHGGIMRIESKNEISSFNERLLSLTDEKQQIAELALDFIQEKGVYFLDVSTVVLKLAQLVNKEVTVYSHSLDNAIMLSTKERIDFHLLGGKFFNKNRFYYALNEAELLNMVHFDMAFVGAAGLKNGQVSFEDQEDAYLKKLILKNAKVKILLAESSKFDVAATYSIGNIAMFDYLITDKKPAFLNISSDLKILY